MPQLMSLIISLSENISLLLSLSLLYGWFADRIQRLPPPIGSILKGVIFGAFAVFSMLLPIRIDEGIFFDGRGPVIAVAGAFGGPLSGLIAALVAGAYRISVGGVGALYGVGHIFVAAALGSGLYLYLRRSGRPLNSYRLLLLGLGLVVNLFFWTLALPAEVNLRVFQAIAIPFSLLYPLGTVLLGALLLVQQRKYEFERALRQSEQRFRAVFDSSFQWTAVLSPDGKRLAVNQTLLDFAGLRLEDVIGVPLWQAKWWENSPETQQLFKDAVRRAAQGEHVRFEIAIRRADNAIRVNDLSIKPVRDERGQVVLLIAEGRDITEQKQIAQERIELEVERQRAKLLRDFVTGASHDFKTPLSVISLNLELLRRTNSPEKVQERLDTLEEQTWHLNRLLDDMMVMLRLDNGYASSTLIVLEMNSLAHSVMEVHQPTALKKRQELRFQSAADGPTVLGNPHDFKRMLSNLIENAIGYTQDGGEIAIAVLKSDSHSIIEIRDTGRGISPDDLPYIFDQFYRTDKARSTETGGSGLGLSIAQRIVELHDGTIEVESKLGEGSTFRISLPLADKITISSLGLTGNTSASRELPKTHSA